MFNRISQAEHDRIVGEINAAHTARYTTLAALVPDADADDVDAVVAAITQRLTDTNELQAEITRLGQDVDQAQRVATEATNRADQAEKQVQGVSALFGAKAKEEGFDVVKAVGDIVPKQFTRAIEDEQPEGSAVDPKVKTEFDELADDLAAGKITQAEFRRRCNAVKWK